MSARRDLAGFRSGRVIALEFSHIVQANKSAQTMWRVRCDCGKEWYASLANLTSGRLRSCGCARAEKIRARVKYPGLTSQPEYWIWAGVKKRCFNPNDQSFAYYGGRGIKMYEGWINDPKAFCDYIGPRPTPLHTIERIDNERGYEPGNVKWATRKEQANNRRIMARC